MKFVTFAMLALIVALAIGGARAGAAGDESGLLPEGPGKAEVVATCQICHSLTMITSQRLSEKAWAGELVKMQNWGAPLPKTANEMVAAYLAKYFNPSVPDPDDKKIPSPKVPD